MKILLLLANQWLRTGKKPMTFWKTKGNNSNIAQEIMTKLHVHFCIVTYTQNEIHIIWSIAYLIHGSIDPTDSLQTVSDTNRPTVGWFCLQFKLLFKVSWWQNNHNWPVFAFDWATGTWQNGLESNDRLLTIGWSSVDTLPTIFKMSHSNLTDCQPIIWPQSDEWPQIIFIIDW